MIYINFMETVIDCDKRDHYLVNWGMYNPKKEVLMIRSENKLGLTNQYIYKFCQEFKRNHRRQTILNVEGGYVTFRKVR